LVQKELIDSFFYLKITIYMIEYYYKSKRVIYVLAINITNIFVTTILSIIIIGCSIGLIISINFQHKKNKKYKEYLDIIKEKKNEIFQLKTGLTKEDINKINDSVDVDILMKELYNIYLNLQNKIKEQDTNLDDILIKKIKNIYKNKIISGYKNTNGNIELLGYTIIEYLDNKLKFRINIITDVNLKKYEKVLIISYENINNIWLINNIESVYEQKLDN